MLGIAYVGYCICWILHVLGIAYVGCSIRWVLHTLGVAYVGIQNYWAGLSEVFAPRKTITISIRETEFCLC
jgi:hypothetical protein